MATSGTEAPVGQTGALHTGAAVPQTTAMHTPGTLHTGDAIPHTPPTTTATHTATASTTSKQTTDQTTKSRREAGTYGGVVTLNNGARLGLALSQLLTIIAFLIVLGGLAALQRRANRLQLSALATTAYIETFQSGGVQPYPTDPSNQFSFQWWVLSCEIFVFLVIAVLLCVPRTLLRLKHVAMAFLVYVFVLTTLQIQSLLYFKRSPLAASTYGTRRVRVVLAGAIMGAVANAFSIIFLGLLRKTHPDVQAQRVRDDGTANV